MSLFRNEYYLHSEKSKKELYESNLINFSAEDYTGKITEDGFKVYKKQFLPRVMPKLVRRVIYQGVFIGEITETENGCDIKLTERISCFLLGAMGILLTTHVSFPLLLWVISLISGEPANEIWGFVLFSLIIGLVICIISYFAPRKGQTQLVENILTL